MVLGLVIAIFVGMSLPLNNRDNASDLTAYASRGQTRYRLVIMAPNVSVCHVEHRSWFLGSWKNVDTFVLEEWPVMELTCDAAGYDNYLGNDEYLVTDGPGDWVE